MTLGSMGVCGSADRVLRQKPRSMTEQLCTYMYDNVALKPRLALRYARGSYPLSAEPA